MPFEQPTKVKGITFVQDSQPATATEGDSWLSTYNNKVSHYINGQWVGEASGQPGRYGYHVAGYVGGAYVSYISRMEFPFESGTSTIQGNIGVTGHTYSASFNSSTHGYDGQGTAGGNLTYLYRFSFPFDDGNATQVGNTGYAQFGANGCNSSEHGFLMGGKTSGSTYHSHIQRLTFPHDSGTLGAVGTLTANKYIGAGFNSSSHGYMTGGYTGSMITSTDRIVFPFASGTASAVGTLNQKKDDMPSFNSSNHGFVVGGWDEGSGGQRFSHVERMLFPFASGTASLQGNISKSMQTAAGVNSTTHGFVMGGTGLTNWSSVDRVTFPFDSGDGTVINNLHAIHSYGGGVDQTDFVTQFV